MPLSLECPRCSGAVSVSDQSAGKRVKCPHCESTFLAPGITPTVSEDDDWLTLDEDPVAAEDLPEAEWMDPATGELGNDQESGDDTSIPQAAADPDPFSNLAQGHNQGGHNQGGHNQGDDDDSLDDSVKVDDASFDDDFSLADLPASPPKPKSSLPGLSEDDEALLAAFSQADDFTSAAESLPQSIDHDDAENPLTADDDSGKSSLRSTSPKPPKQPTAATPPAADEVEYASEYRVKCNVCGSVLWAKARQAGTTVKCPDCYSPITIPKPPKVAKKQQVNLDEVESFGFEDNSKIKRGPDPYQRSAAQLLEEASREEEQQTEKPNYLDTPSVQQWFKNVFGIFTDVSVLAHWLVLSAFASIPAALALLSEHPMVILGLFPGGFFLGLLVIAGGFAILNAVANGEDQVEDWPTLDPVSWFDQLFVVVAAALVAFLPIWLVTMIVLGPSMLALAITMLSVYALFPFVLLSMLDMNTPFIPFSPEVARSVTKCEEAWGGFYFSAGVLFVALFLTYTIAGMLGPALGVTVSITLTVGAAFCYFAMLGRLAYAIGQAVNAPPRHDEDLDRTRHSDIS